jgi:hypothetical protein
MAPFMPMYQGNGIESDGFRRRALNPSYGVEFPRGTNSCRRLSK